MARRPASQSRNSLRCLHQGAALPSSSVTSDAVWRSRGRGRLSATGRHAGDPDLAARSGRAVVQPGAALRPALEIASPVAGRRLLSFSLAPGRELPHLSGSTSSRTAALPEAMWARSIHRPASGYTLAPGSLRENNEQRSNKIAVTPPRRECHAKQSLKLGAANARDRATEAVQMLDLLLEYFAEPPDHSNTRPLSTATGGTASSAL